MWDSIVGLGKASRRSEAPLPLLRLAIAVVAFLALVAPRHAAGTPDYSVKAQMPKLVQVNDGDVDGDGIPDFAAGYQTGQLNQAPTGDPANPVPLKGSFAPLVIHLGGDVNLSTAFFYFSYWPIDDPSGIQRLKQCGDDPNDPRDWLFSTVGGTRVWAVPSFDPSKPPQDQALKGFFLNLGTTYPVSLFGFDHVNRTATVLVEATAGSTSLNDKVIWIYVDPDGDGPENYSNHSTSVHFTAVRIDLDIDSDNTMGFGLDQPTPWQDQIEDAQGRAQRPGKIIQVNDGDSDGDGIPDFADGFDFDGKKDTDDDLIKSETAHFVPIKLQLPAPLWDLDDFKDNAQVTFTYSGSDPALLKQDPGTGAYTLPLASPCDTTPAPLRIWTKDANAARKKASVADPTPGDFVPSKTPIPLSALGLSAENQAVTLYVEGIQESKDFADQRILAVLAPESGSPDDIPLSDAVRTTVIRLEFVVPDAYDEQTGLPAANAGAVPTDLIGVSDPRPTVTLDPLQPPAGFNPVGGYCQITLSGFVKDPIADNVPRGYVSAGLADIDSVTVTVDGEPSAGLDLCSQPDGTPAFWRQHPYKATFAPTTVSIPLAEGTHIVRVETSKNAAGLTGFAEVAVTLSKRTIPIDPEGLEDWLNPTQPLTKTLGLWHLDEAKLPPPPPQPVVETRGLWHFDVPTLPPPDVQLLGQWRFEAALPPPWTPLGLPTSPFDPDAYTALLYHLEDSDAAYDSAWYGNGNYGLFYGYPSALQTGWSGYGVYFDGCDDYIEVPYNSNLHVDLDNCDFTLEAWVQPSDVSGWRTVLSHWVPFSGGCDGYALRLENGQVVLHLGIHNGGAGEVTVSGPSLTPGAWSHVAACRSGDTVRLYVNGEMGGVAYLPVGAVVTPASAGFGVGEGFLGTMDEVRISTCSRYAPPPVGTADSSGHWRDAVLEAGATLVSDPQVGKALRLSSPYDGALVPNWPNLGCSGFALDLAVWPDSANAWGTILSGPGFSLRLEYGAPVFEQYDEGGNTAIYLHGTQGTLPAGSWSLLSVQWTGQTVRLFANGEEQASATPSLAWYNYPAGPLLMGGYDAVHGLGPLIGFLDEVNVSGVTQPHPPSTTADASGNGNDGTLLVDAAIVAGGHSGGALWVGGNGGGVEVPASPSLLLGDAGFTIEAWVCPGGSSGGPIVAGPGYELWLAGESMYNGGYPSLRVWGEGGDFTLTAGWAPVGSWSHLVAQRTGDSVRLLVNDYEVASTTLTGSLSTYATSVRFGSKDPMTWCFNGLIDEVGIATVTQPPPPTITDPTTPDSSGNGHDGLLKGAAAIVPGGYEGGALQGASVDVPASPTLWLGSDDFTIEAWVKPFDTNGGPILSKVESGYEYSLALCYGLIPSFYIHGDPGSTYYAEIIGPTGLAVGEWTHVAIGRGGDMLRMYINGEEVGSTAFTGPVNSTASPLCIGRFYPLDYSTWSFNGLIDEVEITATRRPPPIYASIYIPAGLDPLVPDTIRYFFGTRDATAADPAFTEAEGQANSLVFHGTFQGVETTIIIDRSTWHGLSDGVDSFQATVVHVFADGTVMQVGASFTESAPQSNVFRGNLQAGGGDGALATWSVGIFGGASAPWGSYHPCCVRIRGLPSQMTEAELARFSIAVAGVKFRLEEDGGAYYMKGASKWLVPVIGPAGQNLGALLWDDKNENLIVDAGECEKVNLTNDEINACFSQDSVTVGTTTHNVFRGEIARPRGSADGKSAYQGTSWVKGISMFDFQCLVNTTGGKLPPGDELPQRLVIQSNVLTFMYDIDWKLDAPVGTLDPNPQDTQMPSHNPPDSTGTGAPELAEGKLALTATSKALKGWPQAKAFTLQRIVRVYKDHLARDYDNFCTAVNCSGNWGFERFGVIINMRAMGSGATYAEAYAMFLNDPQMTPQQRDDNAKKFTNSWNCHGATLHAFNGERKGWHADPVKKIPQAMIDGCNKVGEDILQQKGESAEKVYQKLPALQRGDIIFYWGAVTDKNGDVQEWILEHSQTVLKLDVNKAVWVTFGANNQPLTIVPGGLQAETWRWALSPAGAWATQSRFKPTKIQVYRRK